MSLTDEAQFVFSTMLGMRLKRGTSYALAREVLAVLLDNLIDEEGVDIAESWTTACTEAGVCPECGEDLTTERRLANNYDDGPSEYRNADVCTICGWVVPE